MSQKTVQLGDRPPADGRDLRACFAGAPARDAHGAARSGIRAIGRRDRRARAERCEGVAGHGQTDPSTAAALQPSIELIVQENAMRLAGRDLDLPQAHVQLRARQAEAFGRPGLVPLALAHHALDRVALDGAQIRARRLRLIRTPRRIERQMLCADEPSFTQNRRALQRVPQLAHISRPVVPEQRLSRVARQTRRRTSERARDLLEEGVAEQDDVGLTLTEAAPGECRTPVAGRTSPRGNPRARPPYAGRGWSPR